MELEAQGIRTRQCVLGHEVQTFRMAFIRQLLSDPSAIDNLMYLGYADQYKINAAAQIRVHESLGVIWKQTVDSLNP